MSAWRKCIFPFILATLLIASNFVFAQVSTDGWGKWKPFIGEWYAENNGQGVSPSAKFSMKPDLNNKVLIRRITMEVPDTGKTRPAVHEGMIVIPSSTESGAVATYFDDEGRTRTYAITTSGDNVVLTSSKPKESIYRMTFIPVAADRIKVKIESATASSPKTFKLVNEENWLRVK